MAIDLNDDQRLRAERLAREKGEKCPRCGSSDLRCGVARADLGGYMLDLWCQTEEAHPEGVLLPRVSWCVGVQEASLYKRTSENIPFF